MARKQSHTTAVTPHQGTQRLLPTDSPIHGWYRFVLGFPPHLVRTYLTAFDADPERDWVADPFCGMATTPVEARLHGFSTLSVDAHPLSILAARVKLAWDIPPDAVQSGCATVLEVAARCLQQIGIDPRVTVVHRPVVGRAAADSEDTEARQAPATFRAPETDDRDDTDPEDAEVRRALATFLAPETVALLPRGWISRKPLMRVLALRFAIETMIASDAVRAMLTLALAHVVVTTDGNVGFGPEAYWRHVRDDADVVGAFAETVTRMLTDLQTMWATHPRPFPPAVVTKDDARTLTTLDGMPPLGVVITSPPYPNEKDYTRMTRLESVLLGLISTRHDLRALKATLVRSNTRTVFAGDNDDRYIKDIPSVCRVVTDIENQRMHMGKTSGFERLYHRVVGLYFGGMYRHLSALWPHLRPGARCAYVVGDQMSYFRVPIRTAQLLADVAVNVGYQVDGIVCWRTRRSTTTGEALAENVLILKRPLPSSGRYHCCASAVGVTAEAPPHHTEPTPDDRATDGA